MPRRGLLDTALAADNVITIRGAVMTRKPTKKTKKTTPPATGDERTIDEAGQFVMKEGGKAVADAVDFLQHHIGEYPQGVPAFPGAGQLPLKCNGNGVTRTYFSDFLRINIKDGHFDIDPKVGGLAGKPEDYRYTVPVDIVRSLLLSKQNLQERPPFRQARAARKKKKQRKPPRDAAPKREQRKPKSGPGTAWLRVHYPDGIPDNVMDKQVMVEMARDGIVMHRTTFAPLRKALKK